MSELIIAKLLVIINVSFLQNLSPYLLIFIISQLPLCQQSCSL